MGMGAPTTSKWQLMIKVIGIKEGGWNKSSHDISVESFTTPSQHLVTREVSYPFLSHCVMHTCSHPVKFY